MSRRAELRRRSPFTHEFDGLSGRAAQARVPVRRVGVGGEDVEGEVVRAAEGPEGEGVCGEPEAPVERAAERGGNDCRAEHAEQREEQALDREEARAGDVGLEAGEGGHAPRFGPWCAGVSKMHTAGSNLGSPPRVL